MTTTSPAAPATSPLAIYRRLLTYTLAYRGVLALSVLGMALNAFAYGSFMALMKPLTDDAFVEPDPQTIRWLPWVIVGLFMLRGLSGFLSTYGMSWIGRRVVLRLRDEQFQQLLKLPVRFYDRVSSGQLIARLTYNVEQVAEAGSTALTTMVQDSLTAIGLIGYLFWLNWELALFTMVVTPLIAGIISYVSRRFRKVSKRIQDNMGHVAQAAEESIAGQRIVKIHNGQQHEAGRFARINEQSRRLAMKLVATKAGSEALIQFIGAWAVAAIVYFATQPERLAEITAGTFVSFLSALIGLMQPLRSLGNVNEKLQRGITAAGDLFELMEEEAEPAGGTRALERAEGEIEFRDVRFRYRSELTDALKGISVTIKPGQTVAFVGRSGSGKSTLLSLLPRFYDVDGGALLLDGHDVRDYPLDRLRAQIALVDQQVRLFDASVAENIAYGLDPLPPHERIVEAARAANALEFIEKLPQGFETRIGQNGGTLSGGQRQRLAIARALLKDAPILILDEATSALDTESERLIQAALDRLVVGRTTLVIAHRLSTVLNADLIVVMQDGAVVEQGRHEQLLQSNGLYASLYRMQFNEPATA